MSLEPLRCKLCNSPMYCMQGLRYHLFAKKCQTEVHKAKQKEYDDGIVHDWKCGLVMIEAPKLIFDLNRVKQ